MQMAHEAHPCKNFHNLKSRYLRKTLIKYREILQVHFQQLLMANPVSSPTQPQSQKGQLQAKRQRETFWCSNEIKFKKLMDTHPSLRLGFPQIELRRLIFMTLQLDQIIQLAILRQSLSNPSNLKNTLGSMIKSKITNPKSKSKTNKVMKKYSEHSLPSLTLKILLKAR